VEAVAIIAAVALSALRAAAETGVALWLIDTAPPAALSAGLSCRH